MKTPAERAASYTARIVRAKEWQAFYKAKGTEAATSLYNHWLDVETSLKQRLYEANLAIAAAEGK